MASVIALAAAGNAFAAGADDNRFDLSASTSLNTQDSAKLGKANLFLQVTNLDNDNAPITPAENFEEARIDIDDDIVLNSKKAGTCDADVVPLGAANTQDAVDLCGKKSQIGSGNGKARFAGFAGLDPVSQEIDLTVTTFNGPVSTAGPTECAATSGGGPVNCEWVGGNPTVYLHARNDATGQTTLAQGEIQDATDTLPGTGTPPIAAGFGSRLLVSDASDVAGDAGAITLFNSVIGKTTTYKKKGKKKKVHYISARCNPADDIDPLAGGTQPGFKFKGELVYDDDTTHGGGGASIDTDTNIAYCATP
ncbi:MAG: hypothetical protein ABI726_07385 [bacterium]